MENRESARHFRLLRPVFRGQRTRTTMNKYNVSMFNVGRPFRDEGEYRFKRPVRMAIRVRGK